MKILRLAIFLTGITGLAMGGIFTLSSLRSGQEESALRTNDALKTEATQFVDQFYNVQETVKNFSPTQTTFPSYVTNRAVLKLNQGVPADYESFTSTDPALAASAANDLGLRDRVVTAIKLQMKLKTLEVTHQAVGTYALSDISNREGIFMITPVFKMKNGVADQSSIEKLDVTLVDPAKAFGGLAKVQSSQNRSAFLMSSKGKVLAHSLSAFVGTDLNHIDSLRGTIDNLFVGAQTGTVGKYTSADGVPEQVAFVRAGVTPFAFAVEQKAQPAVLSGAWMSEQAGSGAARRNMGALFVLIAVSLAAFAGISIWASRELAKQLGENGFARARANEEKPISQAANAGLNALPANLFSKLAPSILSNSDKAGRRSRNRNNTVGESEASLLDLSGGAKTGAAQSMSSVMSNGAEGFSGVSSGEGTNYQNGYGANAAIPAATVNSNLNSNFGANLHSNGASRSHVRDISQNEIPSPAAIQNSAESLIRVRDQLALEREQLAASVSGINANRDITREFVEKIEKAFTIEAVEKELVRLASEVAESPVLYFRYHRRNQSLALASVAGEVRIPNYQSMQAYVRKDIELQVEHMADEGKVASVSNYGPISKLMMSHLNVAHFEAWAITSHPDVSRQSKLVGVLIVCQAGVQSAQARPLLARILKEAGNYLYAQGNKIRPRASMYQTNQTPTLSDSNLS